MGVSTFEESKTRLSIIAQKLGLNPTLGKEKSVLILHQKSGIQSQWTRKQKVTHREWGVDHKPSIEKGTEVQGHGG